MPFKDPVVRKLKQAGYSKAYYEKNRESVILKINKNKIENRKWFAEFKATKSCVTCGESRSATLDFHHLKPCKSDKKIHKLVSDGHNRIRIQKEMAKCVVLCSNCHRIHHEEERKNKRKLVATS